MKYKFRYIIVLIAALFLCCNNVYADHQEETCYYKTDKFQAILVVKSGYGCANCHTFEQYTDITINKVGTTAEDNAEDINNWYGSGRVHKTEDGYYFTNLYSGPRDANQNGTCPRYLVFQYCSVYKVWGTNDESEAEIATAGINKHEDCTGYYASHYKKVVNQVTGEETEAEISESDYWSGFSNPNMGGTPTKVDCTLFGSKTDENSLAYYIHKALVYVKIIVPILIILLGTVDFARAAIASKEDDMKKAQSTFIRRIIAGVAVFLVPVLIDIIMWFTDIIWDYGNLCNLP